MRIQHNIMAMNAYRNYSSNNSALSKNLEKLSSGYKINRAGDDAAGLAISEKMRAQISGLDQASSNAKSGINLVQTAEGSLTEVHDMLNRMVTLSDQSANGTYDNETDRGNLQKEVTQLKSEIDRIADSSNFNGIKLLDGSLDAEGTSTSNKLVLSDLAPVDTLKDSAGVKGVQTAKSIDAGAVTTTSGYEATYSFTFDNNGTAETHTVKITLGAADTAAMVSVDGKTAAADTHGGASNDGVLTAGKLSAGDTAKILAGALNDADFAKSLDMTFAAAGTTDMTFKANEVGTKVPTLTSISKVSTLDGVASPTSSVAVENTTAALDVVPQLDLSKLALAGTESKADANSKVFEINGRKFAILASTNTKTAEDMGLASDVVAIKLSGAISSTTAKEVGDRINDIVGSNVLSLQQAADTKLTFNSNTNVDGSEKGLTLQIGDSADSFNQLKVSVGDMHSKALGIGDIDISNQSGAKAAIDQIKSAINSVSSTRGNLGALQNRLDHTINNLGVMTENIQDAESTVRDTDVASEMMAYTKNNILVQSAQAMLAQANQVPQGVLQLLQ